MKFFRSLRLKKTSGFTLTETMISIGIMSILMSVSAGTFIVSARSLHTIHKQSQLQNRSAMTMEHIANTLRNASEFAPCPGDDPVSGNLKRMRFAVPKGTDVYSLRWGTLAYEASGTGDGHLALEWDTPATSEMPSAWNGHNQIFTDVADFNVQFRSGQRVSFSLAFQQPGIKNRAQDRLADNILTTDVSAKNHILLEGLNDEDHITAALRF